MISRNSNLTEMARQAMLDQGFGIDIPEPAMRELEKITSPAVPSSTPSFREMQGKLWVSIDDADTMDLDQLTFAEIINGKSRIFIAIADVDALVRKGSPLDSNAYHNTTSVYTPTEIFPMLPSKLSTNLTSLAENSGRCAIVVEIEVDNTGQYDLIDIYPAFVKNHAKLSYNEVAAWLTAKPSTPFPRINIPGLPEQLRLQDRVAQSIKSYRFRQGALGLGGAEFIPVIVNGMPVGLQQTIHTRAHTLIENYMIAANVVVTRYIEAQRLPVLKRIVRTPKKWERIVELAALKGEKLPPDPDVKALQAFLRKQQQAAPEQFSSLSLAIIKLIGKGEYFVGFPDTPSPGHFDLALRDYSHTTAPNRRYPDLIIQRLLKSHFFGKPIPYTNEELISIAQRCTQKEDDAAKVERRVKKSAAAMILEAQIGKEFPAMVTGASAKGTYVRLMDPPIEGKLTEGFHGLDVGDHIRVKLLEVDIPKGYIDFIRI